MHRETQLRVLAWPSGSPSDQNPYVRMMYSAFASEGARIFPFRPLMLHTPKANIFHVQWPESIFEGRGGKNLFLAAAKAIRVIATARGIKRKGGAVVLTAHNLHPHAIMNNSRQIIWKIFHSKFLDQVDLIIGLSHSSLELFLDTHPKARRANNIVIAHPHYRDAYPFFDRALARERLGLGENKLIGVVGSLRPSKNVLEVIQVFRRAALETERLLIAGACDPEYESALRGAIEDDTRIIFRPQSLSDDEIAEAFAALDVCLINQICTLNSGTALLALSQRRALAAPNVGSLQELSEHFGKEWVHLFEHPLNTENLRYILDNISSDGVIMEEKFETISPNELSRTMLNEFDKIYKK